MKRSLLAAAVVLALVTSGAASLIPVRADGIEVRVSQAQNTFPQGLRFQLSVAAPADIKSVRLRFRILPAGNLSTVAAQCPSGSIVSCTAQLSQPNNYLAPGAEVRFYWEIEDNAGNTLQTPEESATYQDTRFRWQASTEGVITVNSYSGNESLVRSVLNAARDSIEKMSAVQKTSVGFPVKVWLYASPQDAQQALQGNRGRASPTITLGQLVADDSVIVSPDTNGNFLDILRHELAHLVTHTATRGFSQLLPDWVDEGSSVFAQNRFTDDQEQALTLAIRSNRVLPLVSLSSALGGGPSTILAYGQSGSIIKYLVATYGGDQYAALLQGFRTDVLEANLRKVYGFGTDQLEDQWRQSVGLQPVASSGSGGGQGSGGAVVPTFAPFGSSQPSGASATPAAGDKGGSSSASSGDGSSGSSALPIALGAVVVLIAAAGGGFALYRRRGKASA